GGNAIAMAHPHLVARTLGPDAVEERAVVLDVEKGAAELTMVPGLDLAAKLRTHGLLAIADAEHRNVGLEDDLRGAWAAYVDGGMWTAGEDDCLRTYALERGLRRLERNDLGMDPRLANTARNQLRHLAAEIDDEDSVGRGVLHGGRLEKDASRCNGLA